MNTCIGDIFKKKWLFVSTRPKNNIHKEKTTKYLNNILPTMNTCIGDIFKQKMIICVNKAEKQYSQGKND